MCGCTAVNVGNSVKPTYIYILALDLSMIAAPPMFICSVFGNVRLAHVFKLATLML